MYLTAASIPVGAYRWWFAASPSPYPAPAAASSGGTAGAPTGTGGIPETSSASRVASPVRTRPGVRIVQMLGSAPHLTRSFMASISEEYAARQNGVAPVSSTPD